MDVWALGQLGLRLSRGSRPAQHATILDSVEYERDCFHPDPANVPGSRMNSTWQSCLAMEYHLAHMLIRYCLGPL